MSDFKIKIMGFNKEGIATDFLSDGSFLDNYNYSDITVVSIKNGVNNTARGENAIIGNAALKIPGLNANFVEPGSEVYYLFRIKNDGK